MATAAYLQPVPAARPAPAPSRAPAPFVKWVGGKGRILPQLLPLLPPGAELMRHVEPFVGGGAMFFARRPERALLSDVNPDLVATYETVRDRVEAVIEALVPLARDHSKEHYYRARDRYNRNRGLTHAERAALFIYLNKTCFNGLYRVNRKGEFNVPAGRYKNPRVLDEDMLRSASAALQHADIRCQGFEELLEAARPGDFIYFDPPYAPLSPTANFTGYASGGFDRDDQRRLHEVFRELDRRGCRMMLSNSDVPFVRYLYRAWRIDVVAAPRAVSCNGRGRGKVTEVVVRNY